MIKAGEFRSRILQPTNVFCLKWVTRICVSRLGRTGT